MKKFIPSIIKVRISLFYEQMEEVQRIASYLQLGEVLTRDEKCFLDYMYETSCLLADQVSEHSSVKEGLLTFKMTYWRLIDNALINANRSEVEGLGFCA